ncbi:MAG: HAD family phosphatase [Clostridia bacterium]|nr:HAD family phosphatase [Clostridia bacterium]
MNILIENAKNVVFDVGCVLLAWEPEKYLPVLAPGAVNGKLTWDMLYCTPMWDRLDEGMVREEEVARHAARRAGDESLWHQVMPAVQRFPELMRVLPAAELIPRLHEMGKKVYVLSNYGFDSFARTEKRFSAVFSQMDGMVISGREKICKPDPRVYRILLERYGLSPAETVFIDDRPVNIEGARSVGMQGIVYTGMDALL